MADGGSTTFDDILAELQKLRDENTQLRKEFQEVRDFNRALLSRSGSSHTNTQTDEDVAKQKLEKYVKGE